VTEAYEIRGRRLGVRWTRAGLDSELRALSDGALGAQDAPANLSIVVGESAGRNRSKHHLYVQGQPLGSFDGDGSLIRAVIRMLGALAADRPAGSLSLNAFLVVDPGIAAIAVDRRLAADLDRLEPMLRRRGRSVLRLARLDMWPDRGVAALLDAATAVGVSVEAVDACWPARPGDDALVSGAMPISRIVYAGLPEPGSRADLVAAMVPMVRDPTGRVARTNAAALAALAAHVDVKAVVSGSRGRLATLLDLT
jgi:hypothetical protein